MKTVFFLIKLPIVVVLLVVEALFCIVERLYTTVTSPILLFIVVCDLYSVFQQNWINVFLLTLIAAGIVLSSAAVIAIGELLSTFRRAI